MTSRQASQDIKQATRDGKGYGHKIRWNENIGLICYDNDDDEVFIGRDLAHTRGARWRGRCTHHRPKKRIIDECYEKAKQMTAEHHDVLGMPANLLLERRKTASRSLRHCLSSNCA